MLVRESPQTKRIPIEQRPYKDNALAAVPDEKPISSKYGTMTTVCVWKRSCRKRARQQYPELPRLHTSPSVQLRSVAADALFGRGGGM